MKIKRLIRLKNISVVITLISHFVFVVTANAQMTPSKLFSTGMILQRNATIPVWGKATAGDSVFVTFNSKIDTVKTDVNGKWKVTFPAMDAGGPYQMVLKCGTQVLTYTDIYIGDVWLCSGQSNMELEVSTANNSAANIAAANDLLIRQCKVPKGLSATESDELAGAVWTKAVPANVGSFSAVSYYFARAMHAEAAYKDIPIGILNVSYGGSRIETWMSEEMLGYDETDVVLAKGEPERQPTLAYNKMINPIKGFPIKGFLWYQGESNADNLDEAIVYGEQFKSLITNWRKIWGMGDLPFIWMQLPNEGPVNVETSPLVWDAWPQLRAAQSRNLGLPNTHEVVLIDAGEVDIHPKNKVIVGERIALAVRNLVYNENIIYTGPQYKSHTLLTGGKVQISFKNIGTGLMAKDSANGGLKWFTIAGADGVLKKADAVIDGENVIVSNATVANPAMVRYAWECNPLGVNFYNKENLPASPFMIDVVYNGFKINSFTATSTKIERGSFVTLKWKTSGNAITTLNGEVVDSISNIKLMPMDTIDYVLKIVDKNDPTIIETKTITVNVINPIPTIKLSTLKGNVCAPNDLVSISADAKAPGGGTVSKVDFYLDDALLLEDTEAPYETTWTPTEVGNYKITAKVVNAINDSAWAIPYMMYVNNLTKVRYEAESAVLTGVGSITSSTLCSNKKFMKLQEPFTLNFNKVNVDTAGTYQLIIRYQMTFDPSKQQILYINGSVYQTISFTAPDITTWMDYTLNVPLKAGINEIMFKNSWGWMSFDYIDVLGAIPTSSKIVHKDSNIKLYVNSDTDGTSNITYEITKSGNVKLDIFDMMGNLVLRVVDANKNIGKHTEALESKLASGIYVAKIICNDEIQSQKFIIK